MKKLSIVLIILTIHISLSGQTGTCTSGNSDGDMICNSIDNCPYIDNNDQNDQDGDGVGDVCDNSPLYNPNQADLDGDGIGDVSDSCIDPDRDGVCGAQDKCPGSDDRIDVDRDGIPDGCDNCIDIDRDGVCDGQDDCIGTLQLGKICNDGDPCTVNDRLTFNCQCVGEYIDTDGDGTCDAYDKCEGADDTRDFDKDGVPDVCDPDPACSVCTPDDKGKIVICHIPLNPDNLRTIKGSCNEMTRYFDKAGDLSYADDRCGPCQCAYVNDTDRDGDGVCDRKDLCPDNPNKSTPGKCGCDDQDLDADGVCDSVDKCLGHDDKRDSDQDGIPDDCDEIQYCTPQADNTFEKISSISVGELRLTDESNTSYFFHSTPFILEQQAGYEIIINLESIDDVCEMSVNIYIDKNHDGDYDDIDEKVASGRGIEQFKAILDLDTYQLGTYRTRVIAHYGRILSPCQPMIQGEVEDLLLVVSTPSPCIDVYEGFDYTINSALNNQSGGTGWVSEWKTEISGVGQISVLLDNLDGEMGSKIGMINLSGSKSILHRKMNLDLRGSSELNFSMIMKRTSGKGSVDINMGLINFGIGKEGQFYLGNEKGNFIKIGETYYLKMKLKLGGTEDEIFFSADTLSSQIDESKAIVQKLKLGSSINELIITVNGEIDFDPLVTFFDQINLSCSQSFSNKKRSKISNRQKSKYIDIKDPTITTYPNPLYSSKFIVDVLGIADLSYSSKIFSSQGIQIWEGYLNSGRNALTLGEIPKGVYFMVVNANHGIMSKKIIIQ